MEPAKDTGASANFTSQNLTAEDLLKSQTSGLVTLSDFRKRRAEAFELKEREREREVQDASTRAATPGSGASTPRDRASTPQQPKKKKKKTVAKGKLSFGVDADDESDLASDVTNDKSAAVGGASSKSQPQSRRLGPNRAVGVGGVKVMTKAAQAKDAEQREKLRQEFLAMQEAVRATEILVPFVFYDGSNTPGGVCKVKKGDHIWLMLDRSRKLGAELGVGGSDKSKKEWARISVDDLMLVQNEIIIPHHYEFYYFLVNKSRGFKGRIFDYTDTPTAASPKLRTDGDELAPAKLLSRPGQHKEATTDESLLEGAGYDPNLTKVVDRRWYERNKHIFPASTWQEFEPDKDFTKGFRTDTQGNAFFF